MKLLFFVCLFFCLSCSHYTPLEDGIYFSKKQDAVIIDGNEGVLENKCYSIERDLKLKQTRTHITFKGRHHRLKLLPFLFKRYQFKFAIGATNENSFTLLPQSEMAKELFGSGDGIEFKTKYQFKDITNYFTKIVFHSSRCFGYCHDLQLELDYSGNLKVTDHGNGRNDSAVNKNYVGKLSYDDLERLKEILIYSQLKTLEWPQERLCFDDPVYTLILYQNDKRYFFSQNVNCMPIVSFPLTNFLSKLFCHESLKSVEESFHYETDVYGSHIWQ